MIILTEINDGRVASCKSDDGLVTASHTPTTTLYGEFTLIDAEGRHMWRGLYQSPDGYYRDDHVPIHIWDSAVKLMREWSEHQNARENAAEKRAMERETARIEEIESLFSAQPSFRRAIGEHEDL